MILEIQHETVLGYTEPVVEGLTELRMEPVSDAGQSCHSFHLILSPACDVFRYQDGFRNRVHHFSVLTPHREVRVLSASVVETRRSTLPASTARWPLNVEQLDLETLNFLDMRGPVRRTPLLKPLLEQLQPAADTPVIDFVLRVANHIQGHFEYARDVTQASSPIDDLLEHGKGVCQDFAHLMIALLRSFNVPARYVSGYIHRPDKESQSHAWCEAWLPGAGWVGVDPTNDRVVDEAFIKVAVGRDFTDTPPNKGVYRGQAKQTISVRVETRQLDHLPSLTWQEHLPELHVPLTPVPPWARGEAAASDQAAEEQQQQ